MRWRWVPRGRTTKGPYSAADVGKAVPGGLARPVYSENGGLGGTGSASGQSRESIGASGPRWIEWAAESGLLLALAFAVVSARAVWVVEPARPGLSP